MKHLWHSATGGLPFEHVQPVDEIGKEMHAYKMNQSDLAWPGFCCGYSSSKRKLQQAGLRAICVQSVPAPRTLYNY